MEEINETQLEPKEEQALAVTEEIRSYIYETAKWASFLAIVGFVLTGLLVVCAFMFGAIMSSSPELALMTGELAKAGSAVITIVFLIYAFAIFYPSLLMFKYANKAKVGILYGEQDSLNEAMGKMKSLFKYWGIITIIILSLYIITIVGAVLGNSAAG
ncbi:hypothetical protein EZ428_16995 [Pedobacter frigiditerrae]|uniref:Uncharacterized protein n=1 Tax=Pedobacter frigiditerrae TaxID=2530452 RepID=A0A4R0MRP1_9SPHI|nr:DUF5362 family protein [Pedobacter frigiditerrae]TCC89393.1 hypothetical protein EZ428_16995 [Pedobacter frigiditerrae]